MMEVEVACVADDVQHVIAIQLPVGSSLADAVTVSDILSQFPALDKDKISYGIYGALASEQTVIKDGDRVQIYRPLLISPMEARRLRAKRKKEKEIRAG